MDATTTVESWNLFFPNYPITLNDIQKPKTIFLIEAYLHFFSDFLDIDSDVVLRGIIYDETADHQDEHIEYYADLLPVMNVVKAIREIIFKLPYKTQNMQTCGRNITPNCILSPTFQTALLTFTLISNYARFADHRMKEMEPRVSEIFSMLKEMESLTNERDRLLREENDLSLEKATRSERMQKYEEEIELFNRQVEECTLRKQEQVQEYEALIRQFEDAKGLSELMKSQKDGVLKEIARLEKEIVIDSEDVLSQHQVAMHDERTAKEKMDMLQVTLAEKNAAVNHFGVLQKKFDAVIIHLDDAILLAKQLKEMHCKDVPDGGNQMKLQRMQKDLSDETAALEKLRSDAKKEEKIYHRTLKVLNAQLLEANERKKDAEKLPVEIDSEKKSDKLAELKAYSLAYNADRIRIIERMKAEDVKFIEKIRDYEIRLNAAIDKASSQIMKKSNI